MNGEPVRVLVVDDSAFLRYTISRHLDTDNEITVVGSARDGAEALEKIALLVPDVVILDMEMPHTDSLSVLEQIMSVRAVPVILLSSPDRQAAAYTIQGLELGAVDFVLKPSAPTDIREVIRDLMDKIKVAAYSRPTAANQVPPAPPSHPLPQ